MFFWIWRESNKGYETPISHGSQRLDNCTSADNIDHMWCTNLICQLVDFNSPVKVGLVIDAIQSTELFDELESGIWRRDCDHSSTSSGRELFEMKCQLSQYDPGESSAHT